MTEYARVENGAVVELRNIDVLPEHKAALWTPVQRSGSGEIEEMTVGGNVVSIVRTSRALSEIKASLKALVDEDAEKVRLRYITPGAGMSMTYLEKHNQAIAVEALGETAANALSEQDRAAQFPTLAASVGIEGATLWGCAQLVIQKYEAWAALSHAIERARLLGKASISSASDAAAAQAAYEAITWPQ